MSESYVAPEKEIFEQLMGMAKDHPVEMINLLKFNAQAKYEDGTVATGAEAYKTYSQNTAKFLEGVGGKVIWSGMPELMFIGPQDESWDLAFIVRYPNGQAFIDMVTNPEYLKVTKHRKAAIETSRLIRTKPAE